MDQLKEQTANAAEEEIEEQEVPESEVEEVEEVDQPESEGETPADESEKTEETKVEETEEEEGELVIEIEGESPDPEEEEEKHTNPDLPKHLRKEIRDRDKKLKQREKELEELRAKLNPKPEIPPEPTLWDEGIDGDEKKLIQKVRERDKLIADRDAEEKEQRQKQEEEQSKVQQRLDTYKERKEAIAKRVPDYEEHVSEAEETLSQLQRDAIAYYFQDKAAEIMYVLGKQPAQLEKLSSISDPTEMLLAVKDVQNSMKISTRKPASKPETTISGQTTIKTGDEYEKKLLAEAERTGNTKKYREYIQKKGK